MVRHASSNLITTYSYLAEESIHDFSDLLQHIFRNFEKFSSVMAVPQTDSFGGWHYFGGIRSRQKIP